MRWLVLLALWLIPSSAAAVPIPDVSEVTGAPIATLRPIATVRPPVTEVVPITLAPLLEVVTITLTLADPAPEPLAETPEPATLLLLGSTLLAAGLAARKKGASR